MRHILAAGVVFLGAALPLRGQEERRPALTPEEAAAGWVLLFDGRSLGGWEEKGGSKWTVFDGMLAPQAGKPGLLVSTRAFRNYELAIEYRTTSDSDAALRRGYDAGRDTWAQDYPLRLGPLPFTIRGDWAVVTLRVEGGVVVESRIPAVDYSRFRLPEKRQVSLVMTNPAPRRREPLRLALSGNGVVFRSIKIRPLPDAAKRWWN